MKGVNQVTLVGYVGNGADTRHTAGGTTVIKFSVATNESWLDKSGERREETSWHHCVAFGKLADLVERYVNKGDLVYVQGRLKYDTYEKDGITRNTTDVIANNVVFLSGKNSDLANGQVRANGDSQAHGAATREAASRADQAPHGTPGQQDAFDDDSIPF